MTFEFTPSASHLREMLPDVAASMERQYVISEVNELGINYRLQRLKRELIIILELTQGYEMRIQAVDVGPGNFKEFVTFIPTSSHRRNPDENLHTEIKATLRVHVEVCNSEKVEENSFSHTIHGPDLTRIIKSALEGFYQSRNMMLKPVPKKSKRTKKLRTTDLEAPENE